MSGPTNDRAATRAQELRAAVWSSDAPRALDLIRAGADVNAKDETEQSAFLIAASEGEREILRATLTHGGTCGRWTRGKAPR